jgi:transposase InsO family protein
MYLCVDVFSRKAVGAEVHAEESMDHSSRLLDTICHAEGVEKHQVSVHADNGGPMKGATMQRLGDMPSVSNDNPFSESLSRTLNYCPLHPTTPLQAWRRPTRRCTFMLRYNDEH